MQQSGREGHPISSVSKELFRNWSRGLVVELCSQACEKLHCATWWEELSASASSVLQSSVTTDNFSHDFTFLLEKHLV